MVQMMDMDQRQLLWRQRQQREKHSAHASHIQRHVRGRAAKRHYRQQRAGAIRIQTKQRQRRAVKEVGEMGVEGATDLAYRGVLPRRLGQTLRAPAALAENADDSDEEDSRPLSERVSLRRDADYLSREYTRRT